MNPRKLLFKTLGLALNAASYVNPRWTARRTFQLFGTPPKPNIRPKDQAFLDTARREDLDFRGKRIVVYSWGAEAGPVVFCAYGWGYNAGRWRHYVPALVEAGYRVVAFDPLGHGHATYAHLNYPLCVAQTEQVLRHVGGADLALAHSFGGGCLVEALGNLPVELRPRRGVFMAVFSEVRWIFMVFVRSLGLRDTIFRYMEEYVEQLTGRNLDEFDVAVNSGKLREMETLLIHDPEDTVTGYRNARRNHSHWRGSALYAPRGAGHHLGTAGVTKVVLNFLIEGKLPQDVSRNEGDLEPMAAILEDEDLAVSGGVSDYYE